MKKRVISILLCLLLVLAVAFVPSAPAARATSSLTDQVIWMFLVQATGSAAGYHTSYSGAEHGGSGGTFPDFYSNMFTQWQASYGGDAMILSEWIDGNVALSGEGTNVQFSVLEGGGSDIISGSAIDAMGILIGQVLVDKLSEFWDWFNVSVLGATDGTAADGPDAGVNCNFAEVAFSLSGFPFYKGLNTEAGYGGSVVSFSGSSPLYVAAIPSPYSNRFNIIWFSRSGGNITFSAGFSASLSSNSPWHTYTVQTSLTDLSIAQIPDVNSESSFRSWLSSYTDSDFLPTGVTVGYKPGIETIEFPDPDDEETPENIPYIFPQEWPESLPEPDPDTGAVPAEDAIPWIIDGMIDGDGDVSYDDPENEPDPDTPSPSRPIQSPGLADVFPFCLPFDVYHFFQALAAEPVAPHFEWEMVIPGIIDYTWEIDLSGFNTVAQILRTLELLAFCVGLAFVTRSMFIRG